jgi:hypothetical protein
MYTLQEHKGKKGRCNNLGIKEGAGWIAIFFAVTVIDVVYHTWRAQQGMGLELRMLAPVEAISDGIDRCKEMGRPLYLTIGCYAELSGLYAPMTISAINIQRYASRLAIRRDVETWFMIPMIPEALPLVDGIYREVCVAEGKPEAYKRDHVQWFGQLEAGYSTGAAGVAGRIRAGTAICAGALSGTGDIAPTAVNRTVGALMIGGNARYTHQGVYSIWFDYSLWTSDVYAAGAYCAGDPFMRSSVVAQDVITWLCVALPLIALILGAAGLGTDWLAI